MTIRMVLIALAGAAALPAAAEVGGHRLVDEGGQARRLSPDLVVDAPPGPAAKADAAETPLLAGLIAKAVSAGERVARAPVEADATDAQRQAVVEQSQKAVRAPLGEIAGHEVRISGEVRDVVKLDPTYPGAKERGAYLVTLSFESSSPVVVTERLRHRIVETNRRYDEWARQVDRAGTTGQPRAPGAAAADAKRRQSLEEARKREIANVRREAEEHRPVHVVYYFTDDDEVLKWRRGQTRALRGVVRRAAAFFYDASDGRDPSATYVGVECVVKASPN